MATVFARMFHSFHECHSSTIRFIVESGEKTVREFCESALYNSTFRGIVLKKKVALAHDSVAVFTKTYDTVSSRRFQVRRRSAAAEQQ